MSRLILTHLGDSVPLYLKDCVHQVRLWSPTTEVYLILNPCHKDSGFFKSVSEKYNIILVFTDELKQTNEHAYFNEHYSGDIEFRKGYWKYVKERFFFIEELITQKGLCDVISMEYDVLIYVNLDVLTKTLQSSHKTLRFVRDCEERAHPAFIYIPTVNAIRHFNIFLTSIINDPYDDMDSLAIYSDRFPAKVHYLPAITELLNASIEKRVSKQGDSSDNPSYLSEDSDLFHGLFDGLAIGQWLGDVDPRNLNEHLKNKAYKYENDSALYSMKEVTLTWLHVEGILGQKTMPGLRWQLHMDSTPVYTIHVDSKALSCFLSDRDEGPTADYKPDELLKELLPN